MPPLKYWSAVKLPVAEPPELIETVPGAGVGVMDGAGVGVGVGLGEAELRTLRTDV